jgi:hypothetical protein
VKALSTWQPWAHLLAVGAKEYETRSWSTGYRGPIAIHAALRWTKAMVLCCYEEPFLSILQRCGTRFPDRHLADRYTSLGLEFGCVIAVADLVDVVPTEQLLPSLGAIEVAFGDFSHGRFAWRFADPVLLPKPIPCVGKQGLFELPADLTALAS